MTDRKTILLVCTAGISTGLLVRNMQMAAEEQDLSYKIYSAPAMVAEDMIKKQKIDALLIGPQAEYEVNRIKEFLDYNKVPFQLIAKEDYLLLDGRKVLESAKKLVEYE